MTMEKKIKIGLIVLIIAVIFVSGFLILHNQQKNMRDVNEFALKFVEMLAARDYTTAYAMTSNEYQKQTSIEQMKSEFETIVPVDWGTIGPIEAMPILKEWPDKQSSDLGIVYVSIGGDYYSEAVIVTVSLENGGLRISNVEFGRPWMGI